MQETIPIPTLMPIFIMLSSALLFSGIVINSILWKRRKELKSTWSKRVEYIRMRPWTWQDATIILITVCLAYSIAIPILSFTSDNTTNDLTKDNLITVLIKTLIFHGPALIAILALLKIRGFNWRKAFGTKKNRFKHDIIIGITFYLAAIPFIAILGIISGFILTIFHIPINQQEIASMFTSTTTPLWLKSYLIFLAIIVAPIVEEICFRGILLPLFIKNDKPIAAITLVSLLFAFVHFHIPSIAPLTGIAAAFSLAYIQTGSLLTSMVMHAIFNSISIIALLSIR